MAVLLAAASTLAAQTPGAARAEQAVGTSSLIGTVRDESGQPIAGAEIVTANVGRPIRTAPDGSFLLGGMTAGAHEILFRKLGFYSTSYEWAAQVGKRDTIAIRLVAVPRTLDPVIVREQEDKRLRGRSAITGFVLRDDGSPVPEAEVQIIGADRAGTTLADGSFAFRSLPVGTYALRVRRIGFEPSLTVVQLVDQDEREISVRLRQLPANLSPVEINARSGYGDDQNAWRDFERRRRVRMSTEIFLGPEDLARYRSLPLDLAMVYDGVPEAAAAHQSQALTMDRGARRVGAAADAGADACILINGKDYARRPLRSFSANDVEMLEVYPPGTDLSGTIWARMQGDCRGPNLFDHPTYYVIWLKDAK